MTEAAPAAKSTVPSLPVDQAAHFREMFESEADYVWTTLRRLGVRPSDLEDAVHEVFIVVHRHLGEYDTARPLRPWLAGIAFRVASEHRRRARRRPEVVSDAEVATRADDALPADERVAQRQASEVLNEALESLADDRRIVFVLHDLDAQTMPEIAAALSIPLNTAYSRLRLAREDFAAAVRRIRAKRGER